MGDPANHPVLVSTSTGLVRHGSALMALPKRQAWWVGAQVTAAALLTGLWATAPELVVVISLAAGVMAVNPRKFWAFPLVASLVTAAGMMFQAVELPAIIGAGAAAGAIASWLSPEPTDAVDHVNAALATLTGSSLGLWAASTLIPEALPALGTVMLTSAIVGLVSSQGLLPLAFRFDHPRLPSHRHVRNALKVAYRPPVFKAFGLYVGSANSAPDTDTRRGMSEVALWVFRLQVTLQTLDGELDAIDPDTIGKRIAQAEAPDAANDSFTRERRQATADHLRRLLQHRDAIAIERQRTEALVDYALAFLEEVRAGLAVARALPGEHIPERLGEVLGRLREHANDGDARRRAAREVGRLDS